MLYVGHFSVKVGNLFDSYCSTIITFYTGAYDSSAVVLLIIKVIDIWCNKDPSVLRSASKVKYTPSPFVFLSKVDEWKRSISSVVFSLPHLVQHNPPPTYHLPHAQGTYPLPTARNLHLWVRTNSTMLISWSMWQMTSPSPPLLQQDRLPGPKERKRRGGGDQRGGKTGSKCEEWSKGQESRGWDVHLASAQTATAWAQKGGRLVNFRFFSECVLRAQFWSPTPMGLIWIAKLSLFTWKENPKHAKWWLIFLNCISVSISMSVGYYTSRSVFSNIWRLNSICRIGLWSISPYLLCSLLPRVKTMCHT